MTSWVVWAVTLAVGGLTGFTATHFSVRTLRYVTAGTVIVLLVVVTAYGQATSGGKAPPDLETAFAFSADRLAGAWFRPLWALWSPGHAPAPGRLGWSVIAVALLLGYRQAEKWALRRQAPQLDTSKLTDGQPSIAGDGSAEGGNHGRPTAGQRHDWLAAELRFRLAAVDVYAPSILPGGTRSDGLASIAESSGVSGGGLAGAVIRFASALWPAPRRYELRVWVEGAPRHAAARTGGARAAITQAGTALARTARAVTIQAGTPRAVTVQAGTVRETDEERAATATRVTVELDEPAAGRTVASKTIAAETIDEAASMVAGYVARQVFARDPASPNWCYGASDGRDLGALLLARQERVYVESADDVRASRARQVELLWSVTGADRCAGVVRYELASLEDMEREQLVALRLHVMNREQYPRFFRGTYRMCMSLEMIANPEYTILNPAAARVILDETLDILYRAGRTAVDRCADGDIHVKAGTSGPSVLSHALRETLLTAAQRDLRMIRRQLSFPVVAWSTFWRRDERVVWKPHWRLTTRQSFRDGVCVAELLVAVKHRLNERYLVQRGDQAAGRGPGAAERFRQRKGLHVVSAVVGDSTAVRTVLRAPFGAWGTAGQRGAGQAAPDESAPPGWIPPTRDRARWLPWQARTVSWQAAYNTACLYAVLARQGLADEDQVVASLRRVVLNRDSGMERPHDWISNDPDFAPLLRQDSPYKKVRAFLEAQERRDYPMKQTFHVHAEQQSAPIARSLTMAPACFPAPVPAAQLRHRNCNKTATFSGVSAGGSRASDKRQTWDEGGPMASSIVWTLFIVVGAGLGLIGAWFSLRTMRLAAGVVAFILVIAVTQYGLTHPANAAGDLVGSFLRGVDAVAAALLRPVGGDRLPVASVADRWLIAAVVLLGYRQLEAWTRHFQAPELDLSAIGQGQPATGAEGAPGTPAGDGGAAAGHKVTDAQRHDQLAAELRFRLPAMEIRCPAILPGGSRTSALASIAESSGVSGAGLASALIRLASLFWPGPRRIRVRVWIEPPLAGTCTRVTALLEDGRTGQTISTKTVAGDNLQAAASMVAGYVARQIFAMDPTVPAWCYGAADGRDLGAMQLARIERVHVACHKDVLLSRDEQIRTLSKAMGNRSAGIVRYELAQLCAASERHLAALRLHALNRELQPRLYRGRYRLAMSLEMVANPGHYLPDSGESRDSLEETLAILCRCGLISAEYDLVSMSECEVTDASGRRARYLTVSPDLSLQLLDVAARDLREVRAQLAAWRVMRDALFRRDERPVWLPHWRQQHRQPFQDGVCVAELLIAVRRKLVEREMAYRALWSGRADAPGQEPACEQAHGPVARSGRKPKLKKFRRAIKIASFTAGDPEYLTTVLTKVLTEPFGDWPAPPAAVTSAACPAPDRIRRLPWQRGTASWQAAYNAACLYAALAMVAPEPVALVLEDWVIAGLRRAVDNPLSELERPSDWISHDPDFRPLSRDSTIFEKFAQFVQDQEREGYPAAYLTGECPVPHGGQARGKGADMAVVN